MARNEFCFSEAGARATHKALSYYIKHLDTKLAKYPAIKNWSEVKEERDDCIIERDGLADMIEEVWG